MSLPRRLQYNKQEEENVEPLYMRGSVTLLLAALNIILVLTLFILMNQNTNQSNIINNDLQQVSELNMQNQELQIQIAQVQNINTILQKAKDAGLVPISSILYIDGKDNASNVNLSQ